MHNEAESIVHMLLSSGADANARHPSKRTALYLAAERGNESIARLLIAHGADVNASCEGWAEKELVAAGWPLAEAASASEGGKMPPVISNPLEIAAWRGLEGMVRVLLQAEAQVEGEAIGLLAKGEVDRALEMVGRTGAYPYSYENHIPDYSGLIKALGEAVKGHGVS